MAAPVKPKHTVQVGQSLVLLSASNLNQLGYYASSRGNRTYFHAELAVSFLAVAVSCQCSLCLPVEGWPGWVGLVAR